MSTNFPTSLDSYTTKVDGSDYPQASHINNPQDAIVALETKVGIDGSAVATSLDYLVKNTTGGHDHDGSDSKKVIATNLNVTGLTASQILRVNSGASAVESSGKTVPTGDIVGTSDSQTLTNKTLTSPVINTQITGTAIVDEDTMVSDSAVKVPTQQSVKAYVDALKAAVWPVGSIFTAVVSTDPSTLLGFGTWTAFGAGRVLVGRDATDTDFDTAEETGGAKTVNLAHTHTGPSHTHTGPSHTHTLPGPFSSAYTTSSGFRYTGGGESVATAPPNTGAEGTGSTSAGGTGATGSGGSATQSVMNPYIVVYMWKRTA